MKNILLLMFVMVLSFNAKAQFGGLLKRKVNEKAKQERDREIDNALDDAANDIRDFFKKKQTEPDKSDSTSTDSETETSDSSSENENSDTSEFNLGSLFSNGEKPEIADEYTFDFSVTWEMDSENEKTTSYIQYFPTNGSYISTSVSGVESLVDFERNIAVSFIENIATVINLNSNLNQSDIPANAQSRQMSFRKTGKTKQTAGYDVEQFTFETEDSKGEIWATNQLSFNRVGILTMMQKDSKMANISKAETPGMVLEIITTDDKNKTIKMVAKEVKNETRVIDITKYQLMNMGSFGN